LNLVIEDILRLSTLLPILLFLFFKQKEKVKWVFFYFSGFVFIHAIISALLAIYYGKNIAFYFNIIFIPIEFLLISYFFWQVLEYEFHKKILLISCSIFIVIYIIVTVISPLVRFNSLINGLESILIITYSLFFFYEKLKYPKNLFIYSQPYFWGVSAFFLFFTTSFFVFLFRQMAWSQSIFIYQYVYIHAFAGIIRNILLGVGMIAKPEKAGMAELT
jgi:hypothetical protein